MQKKSMFGCGVRMHHQSRTRIVRAIGHSIVAQEGFAAPPLQQTLKISFYCGCNIVQKKMASFISTQGNKWLRAKTDLTRLASSFAIHMTTFHQGPRQGLKSGAGRCGGLPPGFGEGGGDSLSLEPPVETAGVLPRGRLPA